MSIQTYDELIARVGSGHAAAWPYYHDGQVTTGVLGGNNTSLLRIGSVPALPTLPSGVTAYIPTCITGAIAIISSGRTYLFCEVIDMGSLNISTNVFTDGAAFPTRTELGASNATWGPVFVEFETALGGTPGNLTVTYVDQDGNTAETTTAQTMSATNPNIGTTGFIVFNSPDIGARDITGAARTGGTAPTGTLRFWGILPICFIPVVSTGTIPPYSFHTQGFNWVSLGAGAQIRIFSFTGTTSHGGVSVIGKIDIVGDN